MATEVVLDACTIITLDGCGALDVILLIEGYDFYLGPIVEGECRPGCGTALDGHIAAKRLTRVPVADVPATLFLDLLQRYRLGDGETECLTVCGGLDYLIATDDMAARRAATELYGAEKLTGSVGLLRIAVTRGLLTPSAAMGYYNRGRRAGAFLPDIGEDYFRP